MPSSSSSFSHHYDPELPSQPPRGHRLKIISAIVIAVVLVSGGVIFVVHYYYTFSPYQGGPQAAFAFLPASDFTRAYGIQFTGSNYTSNLSFSLPPKFSSKGLLKAEAWLYRPFQTNQLNNTSSLDVVSVLIMEMNSTAQASASYSSLKTSLYVGATEVSTGFYSGFRYALWEGNISSIPINVYFAQDSNFLLIMQFYGSTITYESTIFKEQVVLMLTAGGA
ncbi:MAG: hypothetical protein ACP5NO_07505 [Thermoplasmata archaeon]